MESLPEGCSGFSGFSESGFLGSLGFLGPDPIGLGSPSFPDWVCLCSRD